MMNVLDKSISDLPAWGCAVYFVENTKDNPFIASAGVHFLDASLQERLDTRNYLLCELERKVGIWHNGDTFGTTTIQAVAAGSFRIRWPFL